jgi:multicomponent Na+:H+ antiporter subunit D
MNSAIPALLPMVPFTGAVLATVASLVRPRAAQWVAVATMALATVLASLGLVRAVDHGELRHAMGGWAQPLGIEYVLDPLSGFMAVLIGVIGLLVVVYPTATGFGVEPERGVVVYPLVLLLLGALFGVAVTGDLFNLFVSLEIYSIASYALIALGVLLRLSRAIATSSSGRWAAASICSVWASSTSRPGRSAWTPSARRWSSSPTRPPRPPPWP